MPASREPRFLTTREVADLLRMRERRVYDLAAAGDIPCRRVTGRLLFPRAEIEAWIAGADAPEPPARRPRPAEAVAGSHDPLFDWALRASGSGLPSLFDGSLDGLDRLARGQAAAAGCHVPEAGDWNRAAVAARLGDAPVVLVEWARRSFGLLLAPGLGARIAGLGDLPGRPVALRQDRSGGRLLFEQLLAEAGIDAEALGPGPVARTEAEAAAAVAAGAAEAAPGLEAMAREYRLDFLHLATDRFDLAVERASWFEPAWQRLLAFCAGPGLAERAAALGGYDISGRWTVHWNGP